MEARGEYDCAVFGSGPDALFTAFLLVLNGERVVVIREPKATSFSSFRFMPGYDSKGVVHYFLKRWGMKKIPAIESESGVLQAMNAHWIADLRGDLKRRELGGLYHEAPTPRIKKLIECLSVFEKDPSHLERFLKEFSNSLIKSQEKYKKYIPNIPIDRRWKMTLRKTLKELKLTQTVPSGTNSNAGLSSREQVLLDVVHGLFRHGRTRGKGASPRYGYQTVLGSALELHTLRGAPFVMGEASEFCGEMKRILESKGVQFIGSDRVNFKQDTSGSGWDAFYAEKDATHLAHIRFQNLIIAHDIRKDALSLFDEKSRKRIESEFLPTLALRLEYDFSVRSVDLSEFKTGDYVYADQSSEPLFVSLTCRDSKSETHLSVKTDIVVQNSAELEKLLLRPEILKVRLAKKIREIFPSLEGAQFNSEQFHSEQIFEFSPGRGIFTRVSGVLASTYVSYPEMGSFSPVLSSIELARRFARKRKREFVL